MLKFEVSNQTITRIDNFVPAAYSFNYLEAEFIFKTSDWDDCKKTAIFEFNGTPYKVELDKDDKCKVSNDVLEIDCQLAKCDIRVSVIGEKNDYRVTTNIKIVQLNKTLYRPLIPVNSNNTSNNTNDNKTVVDDKLSVNSNNPIANSAVAKVLSGGKMAGVEVIYDYESFMDMFMKYCDSETGEFLLADDEFILVLALDDIYDESGEYGDDECLLKKALYFWTNYDMVAIGEVSNDDLFGITNELNEIRKLVMSRMTAHFIDASKNGGVYCGQFSAGLTQITKDGPLLSETSGEQLLLLKTGDTVFSNGKSLTYKVIVISSLDGCIHTFNKASDGVHSSQYIDKAETEELIDSKLSQGKPNAIPQIFIDETTVTVQPNVYYCFGEVESLSIDFAPEKADCVNEYMFEFISGSIPTTLILPADIKWATDIDVTANKKYQVSILNNVGLMAGVDV